MIEASSGSVDTINWTAVLCIALSALVILIHFSEVLEQRGLWHGILVAGTALCIASVAVSPVMVISIQLTGKPRSLIPPYLRQQD
jgi:hypothetical protein